MNPSEIGSSVTLIFYRIGSDWYKGGEPLLNLIAAAAQGSVFTHVEVAIGEAAGEGGRMSNVLRVFNDDVGTVRKCTRIELENLQTRTCTIPLKLPPTSFVLTGARGAHRHQPELQLLAAWVLESAGNGHAQIRKSASWEAVFVFGNGAIADLAPQVGPPFVVLCRIGRGVLASGRAHVVQLVHRQRDPV